MLKIEIEVIEMTEVKQDKQKLAEEKYNRLLKRISELVDQAEKELKASEVSK